VQRLYRERFVVAFPAGHRFERRNALRFLDLDGENYLLRINLRVPGSAWHALPWPGRQAEGRLSQASARIGSRSWVAGGTRDLFSRRNTRRWCPGGGDTARRRSRGDARTCRWWRSSGPPLLRLPWRPSSKAIPGPIPGRKAPAEKIPAAKFRAACADRAGRRRPCIEEVCSAGHGRRSSRRGGSTRSAGRDRRRSRCRARGRGKTTSLAADIAGRRLVPGKGAAAETAETGIEMIDSLEQPGIDIGDAEAAPCHGDGRLIRRSGPTLAHGADGAGG